MKYGIFDMQFDAIKLGFDDFESKEELRNEFHEYLLNTLEEDFLEKIDNDFETLIDFLEYRVVKFDEHNILSEEGDLIFLDWYTIFNNKN